jgi:hypothetical protein
MDVNFIEHESYFKIPQNPIQGERVNTSEEELNFEFLNFTRYHDTLTLSTPVLDQPHQIHHNSEEEINPDINNENDINYSERNDTTEDQEEMIIKLANDPTRPEAFNEVSSSEPLFTLPSRKNRGKPAKRYVPKDGTNTKIYPIAKYTTTNHLTEPLKGFVNQISSVIVPKKLKEAITDPKWRQAMNEEMSALLKNNTWEVTNLPDDKRVVGGVNGCIP